MLEAFGTVTGLIYLWLEYKASIHLWVVGIIMPAIYVFVYYDAGLYADCAFNGYYLLAAVYGWAEWKRKARGNVEAEENSKGIESIFSNPSPLGWKGGGVLVVSTVAVFLLIAYLLIRFTDSTVPWLDALTTALSIAGMWMLAKKYVEQWWVWFVVDVVSAGLYVYKALYFTAGLYLLYAVVAVFGYCKWKQMMNPKFCNL